TDGTPGTTMPTPVASAARGVRWRVMRLPAAFRRARSAPLVRPRPARPRLAFARLREDLATVPPGPPLDLHDHRHDNGLSLRNLEKGPPQGAPDALFDHGLVGHLVVGAGLERLQGEGASLLEDRLRGLVEHESPVDHVGPRQ